MITTNYNLGVAVGVIIGRPWQMDCFYVTLEGGSLAPIEINVHTHHGNAKLQFSKLRFTSSS